MHPQPYLGSLYFKILINILLTYETQSSIAREKNEKEYG